MKQGVRSCAERWRRMLSCMSEYQLPLGCNGLQTANWTAL